MMGNQGILSLTQRFSPLLEELLALVTSPIPDELVKETITFIDMLIDIGVILNGRFDGGIAVSCEVINDLNIRVKSIM